MISWHCSKWVKKNPYYFINGVLLCNDGEEQGRDFLKLVNFGAFQPWRCSLRPLLNNCKTQGLRQLLSTRKIEATPVWDTAGLTVHRYYLRISPASQNEEGWNLFPLPSLCLHKWCHRPPEFLTITSLSIENSRSWELSSPWPIYVTSQLKWFWGGACPRSTDLEFFFVLITGFFLPVLVLDIISQPRKAYWDILESPIFLTVVIVTVEPTFFQSVIQRSLPRKDRFQREVSPPGCGHEAPVSRLFVVKTMDATFSARGPHLFWNLL